MGAIFAAALVLPHVNYSTILPELILLGGSVLILGASALRPRQFSTETYAGATAAVGIASLVASLLLYHDVDRSGPFSSIAKSIDVDGFAVFVLVLVSSVIVVASILAAGYLRREGFEGCEYYVLALISGAGAMLMGSANDLILIFLALEILSIPLYVMAGLDRRRESSAEASIKYFVLGAFSSAIFVYGIALIYGATGSTNLAQISAFLAQNVVLHNGVLLAGMALLLVGFAFKIAAVPFHMWTPDVYQGSPTPAVGFMATVAKVGGFAALIRVIVSSLPTLASDWQPILWVLAGLSLLLGAIVAIVQSDVKRMLAYSSINHAGFILIGLQAGTARGVASSLYYIFAYSFLVLGSFAVVGLVGDKGDERNDLSSFRGLSRRNPALALSFAILLLAQAGLPFTTGFFAKFYVLEASISAHSYGLAVVAMASAGVAVFFYLRVVLLMFVVDTKETEGSQVPEGFTPEPIEVGGGAQVATLVAQEQATLLLEARVDVPLWSGVALLATVLVTLVFGIWPAPLINFAQHATLLF